MQKGFIEMQQPEREWMLAKLERQATVIRELVAACVQYVDDVGDYMCLEQLASVEDQSPCGLCAYCLASSAIAHAKEAQP